MSELAGQTALVTGGGRGIGANVARELADEQVHDPLSGNAVLNGIPVTVAPA